MKCGKSCCVGMYIVPKPDVWLIHEMLREYKEYCLEKSSL